MTLTISAQVWLEAGGKMMYGLTGFYNQNILDDTDHDFRLNTSLSAGLLLGINFGDFHGINVEGVFTQNQQDMTFADDFILESTRNDIQWRTFDLYALYRFYSRSGPFLEIGPKLNLVSKMTQEFGPERLDIDGMYADHYFSGVFGFGAFLAGSDLLTFKMGFRGEYALTDFITGEGQTLNFPTPYTDFETYKETHPFRGALYVELNFALGELAKNQCGRRGFMLSGRY